MIKKDIPSSRQPPPLKRWQEWLMLSLTEGLRYAELSLWIFCTQQGFLDQRAVLLSVMGLTTIAGKGICNWWLFSMHLQCVYHLASLAWPLPPLCWWTRLPVLLPSHYRHRPRGTAKPLRGEACDLGHNTVLVCGNTLVNVWKSHITFSRMSKPIVSLIMDDSNWLSCSDLHSNICAWKLSLYVHLNLKKCKFLLCQK